MVYKLDKTLFKSSIQLQQQSAATAQLFVLFQSKMSLKVFIVSCLFIVSSFLYFSSLFEYFSYCRSCWPWLSLAMPFQSIVIVVRLSKILWPMLYSHYHDSFQPCPKILYPHLWANQNPKKAAAAVVAVVPDQNSSSSARKNQNHNK